MDLAPLLDANLRGNNRSETQSVSFRLSSAEKSLLSKYILRASGPMTRARLALRKHVPLWVLPMRPEGWLPNLG